MFRNRRWGKEDYCTKGCSWTWLDDRYRPWPKDWAWMEFKGSGEPWDSQRLYWKLYYHPESGYVRTGEWMEELRKSVSVYCCENCYVLKEIEHSFVRIDMPKQILCRKCHDGTMRLHYVYKPRPDSGWWKDAIILPSLDTICRPTTTNAPAVKKEQSLVPLPKSQNTLFVPVEDVLSGS